MVTRLPPYTHTDIYICIYITTFTLSHETSNTRQTVPQTAAFSNHCTTDGHILRSKLEPECHDNWTFDLPLEKDWQCTYDVTMRHVHETIVAVDKQ